MIFKLIKSTTQEQKKKSKHHLNINQIKSVRREIEKLKKKANFPYTFN